LEHEYDDPLHDDRQRHSLHDLLIAALRCPMVGHRTTHTGDRDMKLITASIQRKLIANHAIDDGSTKPPLKLFCPWGAATWLINSIDPDDHDYAFGLCDLGMDIAELGYVDLKELRSIKGPFGLRIERDMHFTPSKTLAEYAEEAREFGRIEA